MSPAEKLLDPANFQECIFVFFPGIALFLALAAVVALAVALGFSLSAGADKQSSKGVPSKNNSDIDICLSPSCVEAAAFILQNIDPDFDPCTDFYNFTCGKWAMKNIVPAGTLLGHPSCTAVSGI